MSWYSLVKAMPLPRAKNYPEWWDQYDGLGMLDLSLDEEIDDPMGEMEYLDHGHFGVAYEPSSDEGKVIKYTSDLTEVETAEKLKKWQQENGRFHPAIVGVYEAGTVDKIKGESKYRLVLEKVDPLDRTEMVYYRNLRFSVKFDISEGVDRKEQIRANMKQDWAENFSDKMFDFVWDATYKMMSALLNDGYSVSDLHQRNVGVRNDMDFVAMDLGQ
jgi:hypothetical protein